MSNSAVELDGGVTATGETVDQLLSRSEALNAAWDWFDARLKSGESFVQFGEILVELRGPYIGSCVGVRNQRTIREASRALKRAIRLDDQEWARRAMQYLAGEIDACNKALAAIGGKSPERHVLQEKDTVQVSEVIVG